MDNDPTQERKETVSTASNILVNIKTTKLSIQMHTLVAKAQFVIYSGSEIFIIVHNVDRLVLDDHSWQDWWSFVVIKSWSLLKNNNQIVNFPPSCHFLFLLCSQIKINEANDQLYLKSATLTCKNETCIYQIKNDNITPVKQTP